MGAGTAVDVVAGARAGRRRLRLFASTFEQPRARRATDVLLMAGAVAGLALLGLVAIPPAGFERALTALSQNVPNGLHGIWQLLIDLLAIIAAVVLVCAVVRKRGLLVRDLFVGMALAVGASLLVGRIVQGAWPSIWESARLAKPSAWCPALRVSAPAVVLMTASPHLSQPARRVGRWVLGIAALAVVLLGAGTPVAAAAGVLIAVASAAAVHLAFGSSRGRPSLDDVAVALDGLGVNVRSLGAAERQPTGMFLVDATDEHGAPLIVKVFGRDAHDTQLLRTLWRTIWYREAGAPVSVGRLRQAEHEAFLTLLARQAGLPTQQVVTAGATADDDVVLVLRPADQIRDEAPAQWSEPVVRRVWDALALLHRTGIAHGQVDDRHVIADGDAVGLIDFRGATMAPTTAQLRTDEAQVLVTTALAIGTAPALEIAVAALGAPALGAALPFVQETALTGRQRELVSQAELDLDDVRSRAADLAGIAPPELRRLRRVKVRSVVQLALLVVAFLALSSVVGGLDLGHLVDRLGDASVPFVVVGLALAQAPRLSGAVSTLGASPTPLPLGPVYALQLATSYIALAIPSYAARLAVNIRFFQRHGLPTGSALAIGGLDAIAQFVVQVSLLAGILLLTPATLDVGLDGATPDGLWRLIAVLAGIAVTAVIVLFAVKRWRELILGWVRQLLSDAIRAVKGLQSPRRVSMLIGGNLMTELLFAMTLGVFARAFGFSIGLTELLLINISVSLLSAVIPVPGGIGVAEGGLTLGLVRAGMPEETALAAVLLHRIATFYLPPIWGFFALRWLERNKHL